MPSSAISGWKFDSGQRVLFVQCIYLAQQNDLLKKTGFHLGNGDSKLSKLDEKPFLLQAKENCFDGAIIDPCSLRTITEDFVKRLKSSLIHWKIQRKRGIWLQLPLHLADFVPFAVKGKDLCCGEVKEETGVETEFAQVVSFRHGHHVSFSKSDLYFMCELRPLSCEIVLQDGEFEAAKWMPLEEFQSQAFFSENNARRKMLELCVDSLNQRYTGFKAKKLHSSSLVQPTQYFFHE